VEGNAEVEGVASFAKNGARTAGVTVDGPRKNGTQYLSVLSGERLLAAERSKLLAAVSLQGFSVGLLFTLSPF